MKKYIGGFFELELPLIQSIYHEDALALTNARACISLIIRQTKMNTIWLPYYTCDALLQPFETAGVKYKFYSLNENLEILEEPNLIEGEFLVYVNYFALKSCYITYLVEKYGNRLLVDNTQDFFSKGYRLAWSFNSARKFFGVPDGGYLYAPVSILENTSNIPVNKNIDASHLVDRLVGRQAEGYNNFSIYEKQLTSEILRISELSSSLLSYVSFDKVADCRRNNFNYYHYFLKDLNTISIDLDRLSKNEVPFCYPFLSNKILDRTKFFDKNIFIPWLWRDTITREIQGYEWEKQFTEKLMPLPVDHRYGLEEVKYVAQAIIEASSLS